MGTFAGLACYTVFLLATPGRAAASDGDGDPSVSPQDAARAAKRLAVNPRIVARTRLPEVKLLELVGRDAVYLRTDRVVVARLNGDGLKEDFHVPADSIKLLVGGRCRVGGGRQWEDLTLLKVEEKAVIFHRDAQPRQGQPVEEVVSVAPYRDARWEADATDPARITYIEFGPKGEKRIEKHYKNDRLDGAYTAWYPDGQKEAEYHYKHDWRDGTWTEWHPNGRKRHEVHYRDDVAVGREEWWAANGRTTAIGEHPVTAPPAKDGPDGK